MKALSNKEIYILLKLLNDKQASVEFDKHFSLSEIERIQHEISTTENKSPQEVFTIENLSKRMYGMEIQTGYRVCFVDKDLITDYSNKYIEALIKNDLVGLEDSNKLSVLLEEFSSIIKDKSNLTEYKLGELRYIPVVLFAYTNHLIKIKSIIHNKYRITTNDIIGNDTLCDGLPPKTVTSFSMGLEFNMSIADEHTLNDLNSLMDKFNEIIKRPCIVSSEFKKNNKQLALSVKAETAKPTKRRKYFSQKILILYNQIKKLAKSRGYQISPDDLIDIDGELGLPTCMDNLTSALNRLNEQYREIMNDKNFIYSKLIRCASCSRVLTAEIQRGGHDSGNYIYYHCGNKAYHKSIKGMSIREEDITLAVQDIISTIEIPDIVVRRLKDKIISSLDELYIVENQLVDTKNKRIKELDHLINRSYEDKLLGRLPALFTEERFNSQCLEWQRERDLLAVEIKESGNINRSIYKNIDLLLNFCNRIPELFVSATLENKRLMLRMLIDEIQYDHLNKALVVKLKPIFEALRLIKLSGVNENRDSKVRTLKKPLNIEVLEYLNERVDECVNSKVRTLKTLIIPNEKAPEGANLLDGAPDGIRTHAYRNHNPRS